MNKDVMFSSKSDLWETPHYLFDKLDRKFHFDVDVCAIEENAKCKKFYTKKMMDFLKNGKVFVGAIHHTEEKYISGCVKRVSVLKMALLL